MSNSFTTNIDDKILKRLSPCDDAASFKAMVSTAPVLYLAAFGAIKESLPEIHSDAPGYVPLITAFMTFDVMLSSYVGLVGKMLDALDALEKKSFLPVDLSDVALCIREEHNLVNLLKTSMPTVYERYLEWKSKVV
jgi:hypothetical protein